VRLSAEQRRAFLKRHGEHLPLLAARGRVYVGAEGPWRWAELRRRGVFVAGYEWRNGALAQSVVLTLPASARVAFMPPQPPLIGSIPPPPHIEHAA
jgi:hypothetical protein